MKIESLTQAVEGSTQAAFEAGYTAAVEQLTAEFVRLSRQQNNADVTAAFLQVANRAAEMVDNIPPWRRSAQLTKIKHAAMEASKS